MFSGNWKKFCCAVTASALAAGLLPPEVRAAEPAEVQAEPSVLLELAGTVNRMVERYGLELPDDSEGEVTLSAAERDDYRSGRLIVKAAGELDGLGAVAEAGGPGNLHIFQYESAADARSAADAYEAMAGVEFVQPDYIYEGDGPVVSRYDEELEPTAAERTFLSWGYGAEHMNAGVFLDWASGRSRSPVKVAVVDSGVDGSHPFLRNRMAGGGYDFVDNDRDPMDEYGHGTHVSGTVADGTLPNVSILPVRVLDGKNKGSTLNIALGILWAVEQGADVINMSLGGLASKDNVERAAVELAHEKGVTVVVSAGNDSDNANTKAPASFDHVICVAACDSWHDGWMFSNFGDVVDLSAPGEGIYSSVPECYGDRDEKGCAHMNGTSMATPHITAAAAMLKSVCPSLTPDEVELRLVRAADISVVGGMDEPIPFPNMLNMANLIDGADTELAVSPGSAVCCPGQRLQITTAGYGRTGWISNDENVATVKDGLVTCVGVGTTDIWAINEDGRNQTVKLEVREPELKPEVLDVTIYKGGAISLMCETDCQPAPEMTWSVPAGGPVGLQPRVASSKPSEEWAPAVYTLTSSRSVILEGLSVGEAELQISAGGKQVTCHVSVKEIDPEIRNITIGSMQDFLDFRGLLDCGALTPQLEGVTVNLVTDLDFAGTSFQSLNNFSGTFYGNDHTVSNVNIQNNWNYAGFFGYLDEKAEVLNLHVTGSITAPDDTVERMYAGGIAGYSDGTITGCTYNGTIDLPHYSRVGGIAGQSMGTLRYCSTEGSISCQGQSVGGIAGAAARDVISCSNAAAINGAEYNMGGIVGQMFLGQIRDCFNSGDLSTDLRPEMGGIFGYINVYYDVPDRADCVIRDCTNSGTLQGNGETGGIGGSASFIDYSEEPEAEQTYLIRLVRCANYGSISQSGSSYSCGGLLGSAGGASIEFCSSFGFIGSGIQQGGLCGSAESCSISDCIAGGGLFGTLGTTEEQGGLVAYSVDNTYRNCVSTGQASGCVSAGAFWSTSYNDTAVNCYGVGQEPAANPESNPVMTACSLIADGTASADKLTTQVSCAAGTYTGNHVLTLLNADMMARYQSPERTPRMMCYLSNSVGMLMHGHALAALTGERDYEHLIPLEDIYIDGQSYLAAAYRDGRMVGLDRVVPAEMGFDLEEYIIPFALGDTSGCTIKLFVCDTEGKPVGEARSFAG